MKTALLTLGLTAVFFGAGIGILKMMAPAPAEAPALDVAAAVEATACAPDSTAAAVATDLASMQTRLDAAEARADSLRSVMLAHQEETTLVETEVAELAATLTRMEDEALSGIVRRLDGRSFVKLYSAATARNQGRLLGALTPAQAASFVRSRLPGGAAAPVQVASSRDAAGGGVARDSTALDS